MLHDNNAINAENQNDLAERVALLNWSTIRDQLNTRGFAIIRHMLSTIECENIRQLYPDENVFRNRVIMSRHNFGRGEYKYFSYPLPYLIAELRTNLYPHLSEVANNWNNALKIDRQFSTRHDEFLAHCHQAGQTRPTPLLLQYGKGDYNCLHQDLYGEQVFPLQVAALLSKPGEEFDGGELVITEQRPRCQSRVHVLPLKQGDAVIFAVHHRPAQGSRGYYRANLRHGVSEILSGNRHALGIIFHDAK
jgi:uncharacterized protein